MSFSDEIRNFTRRAEENIVKVKRASAFDLFSSIIIATPVLEGTLRNNWFVKMGSGSTRLDESPGGSAEAVISEMSAELNFTTLEKPIFFTNNSPYAYRIEFDGWSAKAPAGMVRVNVARWDNIVNRNASIIGGF